MSSRTRILHESLLRLIVADSDDTSAPNIRYFHSEAWAIRPASAQEMLEWHANWRLHWREPELVSEQRREAIDRAAAGLGACYDVIW